jgi:hypothetical protein
VLLFVETLVNPNATKSDEFVPDEKKKAGIREWVIGDRL